MSEKGTDPALAPLIGACRERLARWLGLQLAPGRSREFERALMAAAPELDCRDLRCCLQQCLIRPLDADLLNALVPHLTVGETYFFRDPLAFAALREHLLPPLIRSRAQGARRLRIWSAGCSTGEEAYSLALTIAQILPEHGRWDVDILASDLNPHAIAKAQRGVYREWSFRTMAAAFRARHFTRIDKGQYRIDPRVQAMVRFSPLNLAEDSYPTPYAATMAMDVVFCRNVLMYLQPERAAAVVARLERCLVDGGWLVVSPVETPLVVTTGLQPLHLPGLMLFQKIGATSAAAAKRQGSASAATATGSHGLARAVVPANGQGAASAAAAACSTTAMDAAEDCSAFTRTPVARRGPSDGAGTRASGTAAVGTSDAIMNDAAEHYAAGRYADTATMLEALLARSPEHDEAMLLLARALANLGRLDEALGWCERALDAHGLDPLRSYLRGSILIELGQDEAAAAALRRSLYLDPDFALAQFALGNLLLRQARPAQASRHFRHARDVLRRLPREYVLPEADSSSAGQLLAMVEAILDLEAIA